MAVFSIHQLLSIFLANWVSGDSYCRHGYNDNILNINIYEQTFNELENTRNVFCVFSKKIQFTYKASIQRMSKHANHTHQ